MSEGDFPFLKLTRTVAQRTTTHHGVELIPLHPLHMPIREADVGTTSVIGMVVGIGGIIIRGWATTTPSISKGGPAEEEPLTLIPVSAQPGAGAFSYDKGLRWVRYCSQAHLALTVLSYGLAEAIGQFSTEGSEGRVASGHISTYWMPPSLTGAVEYLDIL